MCDLLVMRLSPLAPFPAEDVPAKSGGVEHVGTWGKRVDANSETLAMTCKKRITPLCCKLLTATVSRSPGLLGIDCELSTYNLITFFN